MAKPVAKRLYNLLMRRGGLSNVSFQRRVLLLALTVVVASLSLLTYLQYRSLAELQAKTKVAYRESLRQHAVSLERGVASSLKDLAELLPPSRAVERAQAGEVQAEQFLSEIKKSNSSVDESFMFSDCGCGDRKGPAFFLSNEFLQLTHAEIQSKPDAREIVHAYNSARSRKSYLDDGRRFLFARAASSSGESEKILIFFPFTPDGANHSGFAGLALRESELGSELFATAFRNVGGEDVRDPEIAMTVRDDAGKEVFTNSVDEQRYMIENRFSPPLDQWTVNLGYKGTDIDLLASESFWRGIGMTGLILVLFAVGSLLFLHVARREIRFAEAKTAFVSNISHELKTPVAMIRLFAEMMEGGKVRDEAKRDQYYKVINSEASRLSRLVERVLDFTRADAGRKVYHLTDGDVGEIVEELIQTYNVRFQNEGFQIDCIARRPLPRVRVDRDALMQAVLNLIDNAVKYSGPEKNLSVTVRPVADDVEIVVADNGCGIPKSEHDRIFERFYRIGEGLVHDVKGSGLGLSIVKHIVDAHGGRIRVESTLGKGSKFIITIPASKQEAEGYVETEKGESLQVAEGINS